ncbi:MAG: class I SAM-dependent methyltransferase, partial [Roseovarius sp.]|nr:class I SAM-dependent methyltransferase [Roseovarius sp.]
MWTKALDGLLTHFFKSGCLRVTYPDGITRTYGTGDDCVAVTLHDPTLPRRIVLSPDMAAGEGYMDGTLTIEGDDLTGFLSLAMRNIGAQGQPWFRRPLEALRWFKRRLDQFNPAARSRANVAHHYDLSGELYDLFLDTDRQYSCAYFARPDMTLEEAQAAKKAHIAAKLLIEPGMRVLDIGCGWGGMGLTLARDFGAQVTGVTLSQEQ